MSARKTVRVIIYVLSAVVVLFFIAAIVVLVVLGVKTYHCSFEQVKDSWTIAYYSFSVLGGVGALLAVVVALFKDGILSWMNRPDISVLLVNPITPIRAKEKGFVEAYVSRIGVKNEGITGAHVCSLVMVAIRYHKDRRRDMLNDYQPFAESYVKCNDNNTFTISNKTVPIEIIRVTNPAISGIPGQKDIAKPTLEIHGSQLPLDYYEKGLYEVDYEIRCDKEVLSVFTIQIDWIGDWEDDSSKMINEKKLEVIKK